MDRQSAEVWLELGWLGYRAELYENGEYVHRARGKKPREEESEAFLTGRHFSALIRIRPDGAMRCTWSR